MYKLSIEKIQPGMRVGRSIYNAKGNLLLRKNVPLTTTLIRQLEQLHISSLYIASEFPSFELKEPPLIVQEKTRVHAIQTIQHTFHKCRLASSPQLDIASLKNTIESIIENILTSKNAMIQTTDIRRYDDYTFAHSVNVCVLATLLGSLCNYDEKRLYELSLGALLHDIGKTQVPIQILNKPASLNNDEFEIIQAHAEIGFEMLRHTNNFSVVPIHAAFQHHEKFDGSGYPRHLAGKDIHEYARIVAIADVYDALTADRAYKKACTPDIAYQIMTEESPGHFDPELLQLFFKHVAIYPVGTIVKLYTGYYGVVIDVQQNFATSPQVRLIADNHKNLIRNPWIINLKDADMRHHIQKVLKEDELVELFLYTKTANQLIKE